MSRSYVVICQNVCKEISELVVVPPTDTYSCLGVYRTYEEAKSVAEREDANETCKHFVLSTS